MLGSQEGGGAKGKPATLVRGEDLLRFSQSSWVWPFLEVNTTTGPVFVKLRDIFI
jgi:hypothetical protein